MKPRDSFGLLRLSFLARLRHECKRKVEKKSSKVNTIDIYGGSMRTIFVSAARRAKGNQITSLYSTAFWVLTTIYEVNEPELALNKKNASFLIKCFDWESLK